MNEWIEMAMGAWNDGVSGLVKKTGTLD